MIKLTKGQKPKKLVANEKKWTKKYVESNRKECKEKYKEFKDELIKETNGKCAYCESKFRHVSFGDVEHIIPKSIKPELYVDWDNLTVSCEICNRANKNDYYSEELPLINPFVDDPDEFMMAKGPMLIPAISEVGEGMNSCKRGSVTIGILKLNRVGLLECRMEKLDTIIKLIEAYNNMDDLQYKAVMKNEIIEHSKPYKEYSFVVKCFLRDLGF